ncbi:2OG-Fe(II) oxygenase family protein [Pseudoalteromonas sp. S16_S37]|uniref:2OG-Fe(II) oxygenase family protein n=1 Tax=Pseudoalteromonas sp. S16_S37 TaxID=2720228 RepID=UPI001EEEEDEC|nr:2OG-Fe(II) oxygenase [Pseudoalteromonas sp. S16_S37]
MKSNVLEKLQKSKMTTSPWKYCYIPNLIPEYVANALAKDISLANLSSFAKSEDDKSYQLHTDNVFDCAMSDVSKDWCSFLSSHEYRAAVSALTGVDLQQSSVSLNFWEYHQGDWLSVHLDKPEKLVNQVIYLNEQWLQDYGGAFEVYDETGKQLVTQIMPEFAASMLLVRSSKSWHAVSEIKSSVVPRRSLSVTFWRK